MPKFEKFSKAHLGEYQSWFDDPLIARRISYPDDIWFAYLDEAHVYCWAINNEGEMLGCIQLDREDQSGYFCITIKPDRQNQGFATRAIKQLIDEDSHQCQKLIGAVEPDNFASIKILEKLGFQKKKATYSEITFFRYSSDTRISL